MNAIDTLSARFEIADLKARYFRLMDTKRWRDYGALFLEDTVFDVTDAFGEGDSLPAAVSEPVIGRDAIVAYVSQGLHDRVRSAHAGLMPEIEVLSGTRARGIWAMEDRVWLPDGPIALMHGFGHYHETYTRRDGRWHIQTLKLTRIRVDLIARAGANT
jgi:hypothetical protein